ncbi:MoaD/ThiS family protein [Methanolobus chelungpuianus]|uniref:Molybdopterin synthase sulfur carrier subunit n=1 Tax=Methanolobus chelungpuianus TaxID=502115 RepID=A0AAE3HE33_9EURY|nr:MoaD/ThiS family protein [Methanolobus chelungpuianus]MCQ6963673.1 hypothetical protein [Methanolobus chelungpuianus]
MQIRLRTFAQVKEILGADRMIECPYGSSVRWLLNTIRQSSAEADILFAENGDLKGHLIRMLNSIRIDREYFDNLILSEGDELALFPPVSGG